MIELERGGVDNLPDPALAIILGVIVLIDKEEAIRNKACGVSHFNNPTRYVAGDVLVNASAFY